MSARIAAIIFGAVMALTAAAAMVWMPGPSTPRMDTSRRNMPWDCLSPAADAWWCGLRGAYDYAIASEYGWDCGADRGQFWWSGIQGHICHQPASIVQCVKADEPPSSTACVKYKLMPFKSGPHWSKRLSP